MLKETTRFTAFYVVFDGIAAAIVWLLFYLYRKVFVESHVFGFPVPLELGVKFIVSIFLIICFWLAIYYMFGYYKKVLRKTRIDDFVKTTQHTTIGVCVLFFFIILDDTVISYHTYYQSFFILFAFHLIIALLFRLTLTSVLIKNKIKNKIFFRTLMVGDPYMVQALWDELSLKYPGHGHKIEGIVPVGHTSENKVVFPILGGISDVQSIINKHQIEDVIIVLSEKEGKLFKSIMKAINSSNVQVKVTPELYPLVKGDSNIVSLFQYPLLQVNTDVFTPWQLMVKRAYDIVLSLLGLGLSIPISLIVMIIIKSTSKGPVFYSHERIGRNGKPFKMYKFRSMYIDAEASGPQLASKDDARITPIGRFMRRLRIDEIPNLLNVLMGDMSIVGPRPERRFYIDQILEIAPEYKQLLKVKPGVTSWGQVKYGYAENVAEMVRRMRYDLLYIENFSLYVDVQILARTAITILKGKGV